MQIYSGKQYESQLGKGRKRGRGYLSPPPKKKDLHKFFSNNLVCNFFICKCESWLGKGRKRGRGYLGLNNLDFFVNMKARGTWGQGEFGPPTPKRIFFSKFSMVLAYSCQISSYCRSMYLCFNFKLCKVRPNMV